LSGLLLKGGRLFDPASRIDAVGDVLVTEGRITAVGEFDPRGEERVVEADGLLLLPGLMDLHVHLREPGQEHKETIQTGTAAAATGGFTTVVAEPNTTPPIDSPARVEEAREIAASRASVRVLQKAAITVGQEGHALTDFAALRAAGAAAGSDDGKSVWEDSVMREAFLAAKQARLPLTVHVDEPRLMARDIALCAETGWPVHFSHVSLEEEISLIAAAQQRELPVTGEASPHHLALCAEESPAGDPNFVMNPPLRSHRDREALRWALSEGVIGVIASDHAPHTAEEKAPRAAGFQPADPDGLETRRTAGVIGLETTVGVIWTELVHKGLLDPRTAVVAMTAGPAAALGREWPALTPGAMADITLLDPEQPWVVPVRGVENAGARGGDGCRRAVGDVGRDDDGVVLTRRHPSLRSGQAPAQRTQEGHK
jgi:dihydroorotase